MSKPNEQKEGLHPRNKHKVPYDLKALTQKCPELAEFIYLNKYGNQSIDFANPAAVKALNRSLLYSFYHVTFWDIPDGYLCPPVPGRADYLHYAADLLASTNNGNIPKGKRVKVLDVGIGANCIYPIIGISEYGWRFVGSEVDDLAIRSARNLIEINPPLKNNVEIRKQQGRNHIFKNIIHQNEHFDLTICNPPFHASAVEAFAGSQRKSQNLSRSAVAKPVLNFGGQASELWTNGGEAAFIDRMIEESKMFAQQCKWFTTLVSKSENLPGIYAKLKRVGAVDVRVSEMATGNKVSRIVGWTYLSEK